jgi:acetate CoA/acetoacetate CoA-transferase beta subunit
MDKNAIKPYIAARAAMELKDGDVVNLGIGLPTLIPGCLPEGVSVVLHSENGIIGTGTKPSPETAQPLHVVDAGGLPASVDRGGCFIDSSVSFGLVRGGHVDCTILGALEVDEEGSLSNWIVPGKLILGMGGAMDLVVGAKKMIVTMEHTVGGKHKILKKCSLPLTAARCVDLIITEMGVIEVTPDGLLLTEYNPEFTIEQIQAATEAHLHISKQIKPRKSTFRQFMKSVYPRQ